MMLESFFFDGVHFYCPAEKDGKQDLREFEESDVILQDPDDQEVFPDIGHCFIKCALGRMATEVFVAAEEGNHRPITT